LQNFQIVNIISITFIVLKCYKMTRKQEALNKAKQSWKKIVEGWKELWVWATDVVWWTAWALWYTLLSGWEKIASKVWESKANAEWITARERKKHRDNSEEYNERAKEHIARAWELGKTAIKWVWKVVKWWAKVIWHTVKWWYHLIDAWDKAIWEKIEKKQVEKWKKHWKISNFLRDNIIKLMMALSVAWYWWAQLSKWNDWHGIEKIENNDSFVEYFWNDDKLFIVDVSENNNFNEWKFRDRNEWRWNNPKKDVRGVSWMYVRVQCERWADKKFQEFYNSIVEFNKTAKPGQKIAIWWYIFFDKHNETMTDEWIEKQVDNAIESLWILNNENDWVVDLVPMLDFEFSRDPWANSERWTKCKEAVFKRLQLFEQKTWIVPWIYTWWSIYHDYFLWDSRFEKYPVWIASYNKDRVDQSSDWHTVKIWPRADTVSFQPNLIQFTEEISWSWIWNSRDQLDWNTTTVDKFKELIIPNPDAPDLV